MLRSETGVHRQQKLREDDYLRQGQCVTRQSTPKHNKESANHQQLLRVAFFTVSSCKALSPANTTWSAGSHGGSEHASSAGCTGLATKEERATDSPRSFELLALRQAWATGSSRRAGSETGYAHFFAAAVQSVSTSTVTLPSQFPSVSEGEGECKACHRWRPWS